MHVLLLDVFLVRVTRYEIEAMKLNSLRWQSYTSIDQSLTVL